MRPKTIIMKRISLVDSLRGFAVIGIIIIHFLEHLNFNVGPRATRFEQNLFETVAFIGSSKMYAIFAILFGLSCYIQHHNQEKKGIDFRPRFAWRMFLLFVWGVIDLVFFNGDILCVYAVLGLLLIPLVKASDRVLGVIAGMLAVQPIELYYVIHGLIDPTLPTIDVGLGDCWSNIHEACANGSFLDVALANLTYGLRINFGWAAENGRLTQTFLLFVVGLLLGRRHLFFDEPHFRRRWKHLAIYALLAFGVFQVYLSFLPAFGELISASPTVMRALKILITSWRNLSMTAFYISAFYLLYYGSRRAHALLKHLATIGRMSLTSYLAQSIVGAFIFYNWGLGLYRTCGHNKSLILSFIFLAALYVFCRWWAKHHRRGPVEELWARATWFGKH